MSHKEQLKQKYGQRMALLQKEEKAAKKSYLIFSLSRLVVVLAFGIPAYFFISSDFALWIILSGLALFLWVVRMSVDKKRALEKIRKLIEINENALATLKGDYSAYSGGSEYETKGHPYALDLDLWGENSIFQLLNRTSSIVGKNKLARLLSGGSENPFVHQAGIKEMVRHLEWSQDFTAEGKMFASEHKENKLLSDIQDQKAQGNISLLKIFGFAMPIVVVLLLVAYNFNYINLTQLVFFSMLTLTPVVVRLKTTNELAKDILGYEDRIAIVQKQLSLYQKLNVESEIIKQHQREMFEGDADATLQGIKKLHQIYRGFEFRNNALVGIALNYFLSWDLHLGVRWIRWHQKYSNHLLNWEEKLADIEIWISGASFALHQETHCFAEIHNKSSVEINQMRHPFVDEETAVPNDVIITEEEQFHIITGPNMAGKSTYLRGLGLSFVLAKMGFPIPSKSCKIPELKLYSSMRTSDDLTQESSYFHAELSRLKYIVNAIEKGEKVFIILDEILKGTNSIDKAQGSARFLKKLKSLGAKGVIATHDLSLCELAEKDKSFKNVYFDSTIHGDQLSFDYKLRTGICQNMNASFLLEQMKLV